MKITIIGAGIIGVTTSYFLAKYGYEVEVLERQAGPALETSFANAGMITPSMADPWNSPGILTTLVKNIGRKDSAFLLRLNALPSLVGWGLSFLLNSNEKSFLKNTHLSADLSCYSLKILKKLRAELGLEYEQRETGSLKVFRDKGSMDKYAKISSYLEQYDMRFKVVYGTEILEIEPSLEPIIEELCGAIFYPDDEAGNAYKFTCELAKVAEKEGVKFRYDVSAEKLSIVDGVISEIITNKGEVRADKYILCAGSFSPLLAHAVGVDIPVRPVKGYSISVPLNGWNKGPIMPIIDDGFHAAITPLGDILRVAGTAEFAGYDDHLDQDRINNLYELLEEIYPNFGAVVKREHVKEWCGFRPMSTDGIPFIGETPVKNLFVNTGHGPLGWTMASGSAKMLCDIVTGATPELDLNSYGLGRS